ncbi:MAG TPA: hypothetical protein VEL79_18615 [Vicinamibacterales bacterium]|nr:hypothetical protein [Vicinamibacterales bacterium]
MRTKTRKISGVAGVSLALLLVMTFGSRLAHGQAEHVRWDIINLAFTTPPTLTAGGVAFATTKNPTSLKIELTGSGTFVAPASGGPSGAVTGGGTWETFSGCPAACVSTGSGSYLVTGLVSWEFDNFQLPVINDLIGPNGANGNAVLRIQYSDGSEGTLGIGCHGPGADDGIVEGVIATKNYVTYWDAAAPVGGVNANRTSFHIE